MENKIKPSKQRWFLFGVVFLALVCFIQEKAGAEKLLFDGFDYPVGEKLPGNAGGTGWGGNDFWGISGTGAVAVVENLTLKGPKGYEIATGTVFRLTPGSTSASVKRSFAKRSIDLNPESPKTYYFSQLFCRVDKENGVTGETPFLLSLRNEITKKELFTVVTGSQESVVLRVTSDATGGEPVSSNTANNRYQVGTSLETAPHFLLIGKMVLNPKGKSDEFYISVIPAQSEVPAMEPASWDLLLTADASGIVDQLFFGTTVAAESIYIDNLCIASDYKSVISE